MIEIISCRTSLLLLQHSKLVLKPNIPTAVVAITEEIQKAITAGWVKVVETPAFDSEDSEKSALSSPRENIDSASSQIPPVTLPTGTSATSSGEVTVIGRLIPHDWQIDYAEVGSGTITITDRSTGISVVAEIAEKKAEQHFTLKNFGTVKGQQFWATAQALEKFDAAE